MQRIVFAATVLAFVTWFSPPAGAQETKTARGTVTALAGGTLTVRVGTNEMKFNVDAKTAIIAEGGGTAARAAQAKGAAGPTLAEVIKVGQAVEVRYHDTGGTLHAAEVRRVSSAGATGGSTSDQRDQDKAQNATGTVESVTATTLNITGSVSGGGSFKQSFTLDSNTRVVGEGVGTAASKAGGKVVLTDHVGKGDRVTVTYHTTGSTLHADSVRVVQKGK